MGRAYQNRKLSMAKTAGQKTKVYSKYGKAIYNTQLTSHLHPVEFKLKSVLEFNTQNL